MAAAPYPARSDRLRSRRDSHYNGGDAIHHDALESWPHHRFTRTLKGEVSTMTTNVTAPGVGAGTQTLDPVTLYRTMLTARVMNDTLKARKTQGKFPFYIGCAGHESVAAVVSALDQQDWLSFYYRDLAGWLQRTNDLHGP